MQHGLGAMRVLEALAERWLSHADVLEGALDERGADLFRLHATELKEALRESEGETLTLAQAAAESGYSESRLRHLVSSGAIPQAGERGRPRVRRGDLPSKPQKADASTTDLDNEVASIVEHLS